MVELLQQYLVFLIDPLLLFLLVPMPASLHLFYLRQFHAFPSNLVYPPQTIFVLHVSGKEHGLHLLVLALVAIKLAGDVVLVDLVVGETMVQLHIFEGLQVLAVSRLLDGLVDGVVDDHP